MLIYDYFLFKFQSASVVYDGLGEIYRLFVIKSVDIASGNELCYFNVRPAVVNNVFDDLVKFERIKFLAVQFFADVEY